MLLKKNGADRLVLFKHSTDWRMLMNGHGQCSGVGSEAGNFHDADICQAPKSDKMNEAYKQFVAEMIADMPKMMEILSNIADLCAFSDNEIAYKIKDLVESLPIRMMSPVATLLYYFEATGAAEVSQQDIETLLQSFTQVQMAEALHELVEREILERDYLRSVYIVKGRNDKIPDMVAELL
jgi:hypothetical protein